MNRRPVTSSPRISTMPRAQTESRLHLERYQIAIEKSRLEKELEALEFRQIEIKTRLTKLADQATITATLQASLAQQSASTSSQGSVTAPIAAKTFNSDSYQTFTLDF